MLRRRQKAVVPPAADPGRSAGFRTLDHDRFWWHKLDATDYVPPVYAGLTVESRERLSEKLAPYAEPLHRLMRIPGVDWIIAATIIAEIGVDMSAFNSAAHLAFWSGICPGNHQSGGKQRSGKIRKGNVHLKTALVSAAIAAAKTRGCYLAEKSRRLRARRGEMRAHLAIAHKILIAAYHVLAGAEYQELGADYLDRLNKRRTVSHLTRRLEDLGYNVQITPKAA